VRELQEALSNWLFEWWAWWHNWRTGHVWRCTQCARTARNSRWIEHTERCPQWGVFSLEKDS
jgi:hypothetical protein